MNLPKLDVYSRPGCHLCEQLIDELLPLIRGRASIEVRNVDTNPEWVEKFGSRIPVVEFCGRALCQYHLDAEAVRSALSEYESLSSEV